MKQNKNTNLLKACILSSIFILPLNTFAAWSWTIDPDNADYQWSWSENWWYMNWWDENSNVIITDSTITWYIWNDNYGWINLAPSQAWVLNDWNWVLSWNAWWENIWYIDFAWITIDTNWFFQWNTTVSNSVLGTINFDWASFRLYTDWRSTAFEINKSKTSLSVTEWWTTDTVSFSLSREPTSNVTITFTVAWSEVTTNPTTLTFTPANWEQSQIVTFTAVDDVLVDWATDDTINYVSTSSQTEFNWLTWSINVSIADNDALTRSPVNTPDMTDATDTWVLNSDDLTNDTTPDFSLVCEIAWSTLTLYIDWTSTGATASCTNVWDIVTITAPTSLTDWTHNITYTQTDSWTLVESWQSPVLAIVIDSTAPVTTIPDMTAWTDLWVSNTDNITYDLTPTFTWSCVDWDVVELYIDWVSSGLTYTCTSSSYTFTPTTDLAEWDRDIQVTITDNAWNISPLSTKLVATIYKIRWDIDDSWVIDTLDIALMQRHVAWFNMSSTTWVETLTTSDVNCDWSIDTLDLALEQRYVAWFDMSATTWCDLKFPQ